MLFKESVIELIRQRSSWRNYQNRLLEPKDREVLLDALNNLGDAPFPGHWRFHLVESQAADDEELRQLGTYGNIRGAGQFVAGAIRRGPGDLENYGYLMEKIILLATQIGLGTCWLGGTFNRHDFGSLIELKSDEILPAVSPVGYVASGRGIRDRFLRWTANSKNRRPWEELFFEGRFDAALVKSRAEAYATVLEMVRLAPSASNKQPWRIVKEGDAPRYHFYFHRSNLYTQMAKAIFQSEDIQRLDMGIALCHFELSAKELKLDGKWENKDPGIPDLPPRMDYVLSWIEN